MKQALSNRDDFEYWLSNIDEEIDFLLEIVPKEINSELDFSVNSLEVLESWILKKYKSTEQMLMKTQTKRVNSIACYIGETFRKNIGGKWDIKLEDKKFVFFGIPILTNFLQESSPFCPLALATTTADRTTGSFLKNILQIQINKIQNHE